MNDINIWDSDYRFMLIVWDTAPINSGKLAVLCREKLDWKKSTTYNAIRRMCEKGLIRNENAAVSVVIPKEKVQMMEGKAFLDRTFEGSLPQFIASFLNNKSISEKEAKEIMRLIDSHRE